MFFGGSAGGAKSAALLMGALQYVDVPGYAALILRRNFKQLSLPGALIAKSHEWLDSTDANWSQGMRTWTFPSGATVTFGHIGSTEEARTQYASAEFQYIAIDELTAFDEQDYRFMFSRLRRLAGSHVPLRMRTASNPGGRGHAWVKARFVDPATRVARAAFLRSNLWDNPHLDIPTYIESLREMHPVKWQHLLYGNWDAANLGEMFQPRLWLDEADYLDESPQLGVVERVRYWDLAASEPTEANPDPDWSVGARLSRLVTGTYVIEHVLRRRLTPGATEQLVAATARSDSTRTTAWVEQTPGAGKALVDHYKRNVFPTEITAKGDPVTGRTKADRARPLAAAMEKHKVKIVRADWNEALFDEMEAFSDDPTKSGAHDDQVDACSGAFARVQGPQAPAGTILDTLEAMGTYR